MGRSRGLDTSPATLAMASLSGQEYSVYTGTAVVGAPVLDRPEKSLNGLALLRTVPYKTVCAPHPPRPNLSLFDISTIRIVLVLKRVGA